MPSSSLSQDQIISHSRTIILFESLESGVNSFSNFFKSLYDSKRFSINGAIIGEENILHNGFFSAIESLLPYFPNVHKYSQNETHLLLGSTNDFIFLDLTQNFNPNKLIIAIETVIAGGVIVLLGKDYETWLKTVNKHRFTFSQKSNLLNHFLKEFQRNSGCINANDKEFDITPYFKPVSLKNILSEEFLGIPISNDQNTLIKYLSEALEDNKGSNFINVIVADRGRGKSAATGLALVNLITSNSSRIYRIVISALSISSTQRIFSFIQQGLERKELKFHIQMKDGKIAGIYISKGSKIEFRVSGEISRDIKCDILIIDEAAAFPQEKLTEILSNTSQKVFITTIHGYEGTGRSFQYKILQMIEQSSKFDYRRFTLSEPIRYRDGDLIEKLLNDTFLLDVEPSSLDFTEISSLNKDINLIHLKQPSDLFNAENFELLKEIMGLLVYSHYRNQPNDFLLIADSYRHSLAYLSHPTGDNNGSNILLACQLAEEGGLANDIINKGREGQFIEGEIIPTVAIRHFSSDFAKLKGLRIVRIATHPRFRNMGLGRIAVEDLIRSNQTLDWIGVSFGATTKLVKFWKKFGFRAIHIRPIKTPETSEWNIVFVKPFSPHAQKYIQDASSDFLYQFFHLLRQSLFEMKPELVLQIIRSCVSLPNYKVRTTESGRYRLNKFNEGNINFLLAVDVIYELTVAYFVRPLKITLSPSQELLLITRILQGRTWGQTLGKIGLSWNEANALLLKAVKKITRSISTE